MLEKPSVVSGSNGAFTLRTLAASETELLMVGEVSKFYVGLEPFSTFMLYMTKYTV